MVWTAGERLRMFHTTAVCMFTISCQVSAVCHSHRLWEIISMLRKYSWLHFLKGIQLVSLAYKQPIKFAWGNSGRRCLETKQSSGERNMFTMKSDTETCWFTSPGCPCRARYVQQLFFQSRGATSNLPHKTLYCSVLTVRYCWWHFLPVDFRVLDIRFTQECLVHNDGTSRVYEAPALWNKALT